MKYITQEIYCIKCSVIYGLLYLTIVFSFDKLFGIDAMAERNIIGHHDQIFDLEKPFYIFPLTIMLVVYFFYARRENVPQPTQSQHIVYSFFSVIISVFLYMCAYLISNEGVDSLFSSFLALPIALAYVLFLSGVALVVLSWIFIPTSLISAMLCHYINKNSFIKAVEM